MPSLPPPILLLPRLGASVLGAFYDPAAAILPSPQDFSRSLARSSSVLALSRISTLLSGAPGDLPALSSSVPSDFDSALVDPIFVAARKTQFADRNKRSSPFWGSNIFLTSMAAQLSWQFTFFRCCHHRNEQNRI